MGSSRRKGKVLKGKGERSSKPKGEKGEEEGGTWVEKKGGLSCRRASHKKIFKRRMPREE